jgi:hypothetical protein
MGNDTVTQPQITAIVAGFQPAPNQTTGKRQLATSD